MLTMPEIRAADDYIEQHAKVFDTILPGLGFGDLLRHVWLDIRPEWFCDCTGDDHHWNCPLTPIYARLIDEIWPRRWLLGSSAPAAGPGIFFAGNTRPCPQCGDTIEAGQWITSDGVHLACGQQRES